MNPLVIFAALIGLTVWLASKGKDQFSIKAGKLYRVRVRITPPLGSLGESGLSPLLMGLLGGFNVEEITHTETYSDVVFEGSSLVTKTLPAEPVNVSLMGKQYSLRVIEVTGIASVEGLLS